MQRDFWWKPMSSDVSGTIEVKQALVTKALKVGAETHHNKQKNIDPRHVKNGA